MKYWNHYHYKNLTFLLLSLIFAGIIFRLEIFHTYLLHLGNLGYIGAFIAGVMFVSSFTVATGAVILLVLAETLSPIELGIVAGFGGVVGDYTIFRFVKNGISQELDRLYDHVDEDHHFVKVLNSKYFSWTLPVIGAIIIASPFPDEIGVSLMGISKMSSIKFIMIAFVLDFLSVIFIISLSSFIKP